MARAVDRASGAASGPPVPVLISTEAAMFFDIADDGKIAFGSMSISHAVRRRAFDVRTLTASDEVETLIDGSRAIARARVSPDGRWIGMQVTEQTEDLFLISVADRRPASSDR